LQLGTTRNKAIMSHSDSANLFCGFLVWVRKPYIRNCEYTICTLSGYASTVGYAGFDFR